MRAQQAIGDIRPLTAELSACMGKRLRTGMLPVFLDTETTGLFAADGAELLEVAVVREDGIVLFESLIKPKHTAVWPAAMAVNYISPKMVQDAPTIDDLADELIDTVCGRDVYMWNAPFDQQFVGFATEYATSVICAMREYGDFIERAQPHSARQPGWYSLERTAKDLGIEVEGQAHRAITDVITMMRIRQAWLAIES